MFVIFMLIKRVNFDFFIVLIKPEGNYDDPGRGHNGTFTEQDTTYMVYRTYTRSAQGNSLLNVKPLYFDKDELLSLNTSNKLFKIATPKIKKAKN